jgi:hypothetical protein
MRAVGQTNSLCSASSYLSYYKEEHCILECYTRQSATGLKVISTGRSAPTWFSTLKMKKVRYFETSVNFYLTTGRNTQNTLLFIVTNKRTTNFTLRLQINHQSSSEKCRKKIVVNNMLLQMMFSEGDLCL